MAGGRPPTPSGGEIDGDVEDQVKEKNTPSHGCIETHRNHLHKNSIIELDIMIRNHICM